MHFNESCLSQGAVYKKFKEYVVNYRFRPYEPLQIPQLAERFHVGRTPLREALTRLHVESLVLAAPNRGFFAKMLTTAEMSARYELAFLILEYAVSMGLGQGPLIYSCTSSCVPNTHKGSNGSGHPEDHNALAIIQEKIYVNIAELSGNPMMVDSIKSFNEQTHFVRLIDISLNAKEILADTNTLVRCLNNGEVAGALENLRRQLRNVLDRMEKLVNEGNLRSLRSGPR